MGELNLNANQPLPQLFPNRLYARHAIRARHDFGELLGVIYGPRAIAWNRF